MKTNQPKAPRKTPQRLSLRDQLCHDYCMRVLSSTATFDMLNREDGIYTARLVKLGYEYADTFIAAMGGAS